MDFVFTIGNGLTGADIPYLSGSLAVPDHSIHKVNNSDVLLQIQYSILNSKHRILSPINILKLSINTDNSIHKYISPNIILKNILDVQDNIHSVFSVKHVLTIKLNIKNSINKISSPTIGLIIKLDIKEPLHKQLVFVDIVKRVVEDSRPSDYRNFYLYTPYESRVLQTEQESGRMLQTLTENRILESPFGS